MRQDEQQESFKVYRLGRLRERYAVEDDIDIETYEREVDDALHGRVPSDKGWATTYSLKEMRQWAAEQDRAKAPRGYRSVAARGESACLSIATEVLVLTAAAIVLLGRLLGLL